MRLSATRLSSIAGSRRSVYLVALITQANDLIVTQSNEIILVAQ